MTTANEYWTRVRYPECVPSTLFRFNRKEAREEVWQPIKKAWLPHGFGGDLIEGRLERMTEEQAEQHFPGAVAAPKGQAELAQLLAQKLHAEQVDKAGQPYIGHLERVAAAVDSDTLKAVAWLHDSIEDCGIGVADLRQQGIAVEVIEGVQAMTKVEGEPYEAYLARVKANPIARQVKLADLADNMDLSRLPNPSEKDQQRRQKYQQAVAYLQQLS